MSTELLNLGMSGMMAQNRRLQVIGHNISNNATVGYKSGNISFAEAFYSSGGGMEASGLRGDVGQGVSVAGTSYDWRSGSTNDTGIMTHLAVVGDGFIPVKYGNEVLFTRAGDFDLAEIVPPDSDAGTPGEYVLMRPNGARLLDDTGTSVITFNGLPDSLEIQSDGGVYVDDSGVPVATVGLQRFATPDALIHREGGLFAETQAAGALAETPSPVGTNGTGYLRQGALEQSNVDLTREFTNMIAAQRSFSANSRSVTTADAILQEILAMKR